MSIILGIILVLLCIIFSIAAYGISSYHDHSIKSLWSSGWGTRLDALLIAAGLLLTVKNLITL